MKQKIILAVSVVVGLLAAFLTRTYIASRERAVEEELALLNQKFKKVDVVVTIENLAPGTTLEAEDLRVLAVPENALSSQTIRATPGIEVRLVGRTLATAVERRRPLQWSDIEGGAPTPSGLADQVKREWRAISVSVNGAASVSNMVRPADHVDVLGTFSLPSKTVPGATEMVTRTLLQDVLVLATGQQTAQSLSEGGNYSLVTLEVLPHEAEVLTFAEQMRGRLTLVLRNPKDQTYVKELMDLDFSQIRSDLEALNQQRQKKLK